MFVSAYTSECPSVIQLQSPEILVAANSIPETSRLLFDT